MLIPDIAKMPQKRKRLHAVSNCEEVFPGLGMLPGAFKHAAGSVHALKPDLFYTAAGQSRDSREVQNQERITSLQMLPRNTNIVCVLICAVFGHTPMRLLARCHTLA